MYRKIKGYDHHYVNEYGSILNRKTMKVLKPFVGCNGYLYVKPCEYGQSRHLSVHRAVAFAFCPGYFDGAVVDHIDKDVSNNYYKNLEWVTIKENIDRSYSTMGPKRNYKIVYILNDAEERESLVGPFESVKDASLYAEKYLGCSFSMMYKHKFNKGYILLEV